MFGFGAKTKVLVIIIFLLVLSLVITCLWSKKLSDSSQVFYLSVEGWGHYTVYEYISGEACLISGYDFSSISREELSRLWDSRKGDSMLVSQKAILSAKEAAQYGISYLCQAFKTWTYKKNACVCFNTEANAWIVHGQLESRYYYNEIGVIVFSADTGEILMITLVEP